MLFICNEKNKKAAAGGFTLIEVVVALSLAAILITTIVLSLSAYVHTQKFRKQNEYAQSLFIAAQTSLTHMKSTGELADFAEQVMRHGDSFNRANNYLGVTEPDYSEYADDRIYSIRKSADSGEGDSEAALIDRLLGDYIFDQSILAAAICIELDPSEGIVTAVLYSDSTANLEYTGSGANITDRERSVRRDNMVGFWCADSVSDVAPGALGKPKVENLKLVNDETLHLDWSMSMDPSFYTYDIRVRSKADKKEMMSITVPGTDLAEAWNNTDHKGSVTLLVKFSELNDTRWIPFYVSYVDGVISLVFDAIDFQDINRDGEVIEESRLSFSRFEFEGSGVCGTEDIHVRIQAQAQGSKTSQWAQSNDENPYFSKYTAVSDGTYDAEYEIKNMRHLSNIRIKETNAGDCKYSYKQIANVTWSGTGSILANGKVFSDMTPVTVEDEAAAFPPISLLGSKSLYTSNRANSVNGLIVNTDGMAGLFRVIEGEVYNIKINDADVTGSGNAEAGILCAKLSESGKIHDLEISGKVSGRISAGGVVGFCCGSISNTEMSGEVSGIANVGGIAGYCDKTGSISSTDSSALIYAAVTADSDSDSEAKQNFGGIVGYNAGTLNNTNSTMKYDTDYVDEYFLNNLTGTDVRTNGSVPVENVGGIVGFNTCEGTISSCNVGSASEMGYVLGIKNVGGIIGRQEIKDDEPLTLEAENSKSRAYCIGQEYVGGIIGIVQEKLTITGWESNGISIAIKKFAGGITGYNAGGIEDCTVLASNASIYRETAIKYGSSADYVGGAVGYNCGVMSASDENKNCSVSAVVVGHNFVGGVIGYNTVTDSGSMVSGWEMRGGYVIGKNFVGGFIGMNLNPNIFGGVVRVMPNLVEGTNFVGGAIGGNIMILPKSVDSDNTDYTISAKFSCNNFLGEIQGSAFTGGYIGYTAMLTKTGTETNPEDINTTGEFTAIDDAVCDIFFNNIMNSLDEYDSRGAIGEFCELSTKIGNSSPVGLPTIQDNRSVTFIIEGEGDIILSSVKGSLYTGGALGYAYDPEPCAYELRNIICGINNITTDGELPLENLTLIGGIDNPMASYTGGITGYVGKRTTLDNCSISSGIRITAKGTFYGGLCEINAGTIKNCKASGFGSQQKSCVGGLAGINLEGGIIEQCSLEGRIFGNNFVGGICAYNMGEIMGVTIGTDEAAGSVGATGGYSGGITAVNDSSGTIKQKDAETPTVINWLVLSSSGDMAGGAVGYNLGTVENVDNLTSSSRGTTITGRNYVGGVIGLAGGKNQISGIDNSASVFATGSYAGGIVGYIEDWQADGTSVEIAINNCKNQGIVNVGAAYCGGIVSVLPQNCTITECTNSADITASSAAGNQTPAGGICSVNRGVITKSETSGTKDRYIIVRGGNMAGGIAGLSEYMGVITECTVMYVSVSDLPTSSVPGSVGGIVGRNVGSINGCTVGASDAHIQVSTSYTGGSIGGAVGVNAAETVRIDGSDKVYYGVLTGSTINETVETEPVVIYADMNQSLGVYFIGGAAGTNNGEVSYIRFGGSIVCGSAGDYGYGGIAGRNSGSNAKILYCTNLSSLKATGDEGNIIRLGGIAGVNENMALVKNCQLGGSGSGSSCSITTSFAWVGGIVGYNTAIVQDCTVDENNTDAVTIETKKGDIGGIIGRNGIGGKITNCSTGYKWTVTATETATDNTVAGICGYNCSAENLSGLINRAAVTKRQGNAVGGIFGRLEIQGSSAWVISDCKNYGEINGRERVGGIVGMLKYRGGTFTNCENYGKIVCSTFFAGGIMGCTYYMDDGETLSIQSCNNFGSITATRDAAGIIGFLQRSANAILRLGDCVNTGAITGNRVAGMISGMEQKASSIEIIRCRNYASGASNFYGISYGINSKSVTIENCVNIPTIDNPITNTSSTAIDTNNYYLIEKIGGDIGDGDCYISQIETPGTAEDNYVSYMADSNAATRWLCQLSDTVADTANIEERSFYITLSDEMTISSLSFLWFGGSDPSEGAGRLYEYSVTWYDKDGAEKTVTYNDGSEFFEHISYYKDNSGEPSDGDYSTITLSEPVTAKKIKVTLSSVKDYPESGEGAESKYISLYDVKFVPSGDSGQKFVVTDNLVNSDDGKNATYQDENVVAPTDKIGTAMEVSKDKDAETWSAKTTIPSRSETIRDLPYNPLTVAGKSAREIYDDIDEKIRIFYSADKDKISAPVIPNACVDDIGGGVYKLIWNYSSDAYQYKVNIYLSNNAEPIDTITMAAQSSFFYRLDDAYHTGDYYLSFDVTAYAYGDIDEIDANHSDDSTMKSETVRSTNVHIKKLLPQPRFYLELVANNDSACLVATLANPEDYSGDLISNITIELTGTVLPNKKVTISTLEDDTLKSDAFNVSNSTDSNPILGKAVPKADIADEYSSSARMSYDTAMVNARSYRETMLYASTTYIKPNHANSSGWMGISDNDLSYSIRLSRGSAIQFYARSETVMFDETLKCNVAYSAVESRLSSDTRDIVVTLTDLPAALLQTDEPVVIRSYPWYTQNAMEYFGHVVAQNINYDELTALIDNGTKVYSPPDSDAEPETDENGNVIVPKATLAAGYVIEYAKDENGRLKKDLTDEDGDPIDDEFNVYYSITLDEAAFAGQLQQHEFEYIKDTSIMQIVPRNIRCEVGDGKYTFYWDEMLDGEDEAAYNANYSGALYEYEIIGILPNADGGPDDEVMIFTDTGEEKSTTIIDAAWNYSKVRVTVRRLGEVDSPRYPAFTDKLCSVLTQEINISLPLPSVNDPDINRAALTGSGDEAKDELRYRVSWLPSSSSEALKDSVERYTVYVANEYLADKILDKETITDEQLEAHAIWRSTDSQLDNILLEIDAETDETAEYSMLLDLGEVDEAKFPPNKKLYVWVIAEAVEQTDDEAESLGYSDSQAEHMTEFTLPERLTPPNELTIAPPYSNEREDAVSLSDFEGGAVALKASGSETVDGRYVTEAYLYENQPAEDAAFGADGGVHSIPKTIMNGSLADSSLNLVGLDGEWAGYWLRVRVRTVSDSAISSRWTYETLRLPKIKLDAPALNPYTVNNYPIETTVYTPFSDAEAGDGEINIERSFISFEPVDYADAYIITIDDVAYEPITAENTSLIRTDSEDVPQYDFGYFVQNGFVSSSVSYSLSASLEYTDADGDGDYEFILALPNHAHDDQNYPVNQKVVVQAIITDAEKSTRYVNSDESEQTYTGTYVPIPEPVTIESVEYLGEYKYEVSLANPDDKLYVMSSYFNARPVEVDTQDGTATVDLSAHYNDRATVYFYTRAAADEDETVMSIVTSAVRVLFPPAINNIEIAPDDNSYTVTVTLGDIDGWDDIIVSVNGVECSDNGDKYTCTVRAADGAINGADCVIKIEATNADGTVTLESSDENYPMFIAPTINEDNISTELTDSGYTIEFEVETKLDEGFVLVVQVDGENCEPEGGVYSATVSSEKESCTITAWVENQNGDVVSERATYEKQLQTN